jgi:hypothetical protein
MVGMRQSLAAMIRKPAGAILLIALWLSLFPAALQASNIADDRGPTAYGGASSLMQLIGSEAASPERQSVVSRDPASSSGGPDDPHFIGLRQPTLQPPAKLAADRPARAHPSSPPTPFAHAFQARAPPHA